MFNNKITIIQQIIPKYRVSFFNELHKEIDFTMYTSHKGLERSINTVFDNIKFKNKLVKNITFKNILNFQFLPFRKLLSKDIIIFEFNIRILSNIILLSLRLIANKKNILWTHGISENMSLISKFIRIFYMKRASAVIVYESLGKNNLIKLGIPENKIFFSKNSIDIKEIIKFRDTSKKKFRITFIGRVIKDKNVSLLCKSYLNIIHKIDKSIILTIIGSGEELDDLKKLYSNNRIEFIGHLHDEKKISQYLNQTLFTVSPDYLGLSIIHSFCYSVPLLVNGNPNIKHSPEIELFHNNKNGWYFDGTQNDLEDKMIKFMKNIKKLSIFGQDGFNKVKSEYGIEVMVKFFIEAIRSSRY